MRLATLNTPQGPRPAVLVGDSYVDLLWPTTNQLPRSVRAILSDPAAMASVKSASARPNATKIPVATAKLHAPVPDAQKVILCRPELPRSCNRKQDADSQRTRFV